MSLSTAEIPLLRPSIDPSSTRNSMISVRSYREKDALRVFQNAIGINSAAGDLEAQSRAAPNRGVYKEVVRAEKWRYIEYIASSIVINTCILAQIILAAVLTASGAASWSYGIITVLGAFNTALAGILALMKGRGVPNRQLQEWQEMRKLRTYIEERERVIEEGLYQPEDLKAEVQAIFDRFEAVVRSSQNNQPDFYVRPDISTPNLGSGSSIPNRVVNSL